MAERETAPNPPFILDTHSDTLWAMGARGMDWAETAVTPERLAAGGVTVQTFALWTGPKGNRGDVAGTVRAELAARAQWEAAGVRQVADPAEAVGSGKPCFMLSVEGGEVFEPGLETVAEYKALGVRMAAILWNNENALGFSAKSGEKRGLKPYGLAVVREMQRAGMGVDVSHLNEAGFWDILEKTDIPPLASHSCCKALCGHARNLTDGQLRALIEKGGYVGVNFYPYFLDDAGEADTETIANHIDHICQLGGEGIVGLGSDFDGIEVSPRDLRHPGELGNLFAALSRRGYGEETLAAIAGGNYLRYDRQWLTDRGSCR